jgi:hypothetical protein
MEDKIIPKCKAGIVIFAGAGCSMAPPSSLPGWNNLNDLILETLWDHLEVYGFQDRFREKILSTIMQKREENKFPPDYQAQRMVERAGIKYFQLLSAVDSEHYNATQYYTANLAKQGIVKAIVTTNFDCNFERAFEAFGIPYHSYYDEEGFNQLSFPNSSPEVPIIKIHGCCSSPGSMIDTRKQRLQGRAKALEHALIQLMHGYHFIFGGFSGQDFDDNENYLGMRDAAPLAKGFTYLYFPGSTVRESMNQLIDFYGKDKAISISYDPALYLEQLTNEFDNGLVPFTLTNAESKLPFKDKLKEKLKALEPMDAVNMLIGLVESYGDEKSARYLYDKAWHNRSNMDYDGDALSRFLLNHGRSYIFNLEDKKERAESAGAYLTQFSIGDSGTPDDRLEEVFTNPAKRNLTHMNNNSPETKALIGLGQTYAGNPILFIDFPKNILPYFKTTPDETETADIYYYYSFYALIYGDFLNGIKYLNQAISDMEKDFDEPRISQLLSRKAMLLLRVKDAVSTSLAEEDVARARALAEKYHEPHLLALSALVLAIVARNKKDYKRALEYISEAEKNYFELKRIPQYVESIVEHLKIIWESFQDDSYNHSDLITMVSEIRTKVENYVVERVNVFEPEYCYLMGMILWNFSDAKREEVLPYFADSINLARQFKQEANYEYYKETYRQLNMLEDIEKKNW